jgi:hypothetical protein
MQTRVPDEVLVVHRRDDSETVGRLDMRYAPEGMVWSAVVADNLAPLARLKLGWSLNTPAVLQRR